MPMCTNYVCWCVYVWRVLLQLVPMLLPESERKSVVATKLLREILANTVLQVR